MSVTEDDVRWCYRILLDREPESTEVVQVHLPHQDRASLVRSFMAGAEFQERHPVSGSFVGRLPLDSARAEIDSSASPAELEALLGRIRAAWVHMGLERPHFSVLTHTRFLPENLDRSIDEFWRSGEENIAVVARLLDRFDFGPTAHKACVEYGCGVGRLTMALARRFSAVTAYDISAGHLALARTRAAELGMRNVQFSECSANLLQPLEAADFFCSFIVFQHNPPPVMRGLVDNALGCLNRGGIAIFQLPTYINGYRFSKKDYLEGSAEMDMEMHCLPQAIVFEIAARRGCEVLEVREDDWTGRSDMFLSNTFVIRRKRAWWSRA